jgi:hypothetical protein
LIDYLLGPPASPERLAMAGGAAQRHILGTGGRSKGMRGMVAGWTTTSRRPLEQARTSSSYFWDVIPAILKPQDLAVGGRNRFRFRPFFEKASQSLFCTVLACPNNVEYSAGDLPENGPRAQRAKPFEGLQPRGKWKPRCSGVLKVTNLGDR